MGAGVEALPDLMGGAPRVLLMVGGGAAVVGLLLWLWLLRRLLRAILGRPQVPVRGGRYVLAFVLAALSGGIAAGALLLAAALTGYRAFTQKTRVAEVQCIDLAPGKLRLYYVPIEPDGRRGATQTFDLDGDEWTVGGEVMRFRPTLVALGLPPFHGVTRVEGRWMRAEDANAHKPTAYDLHASTLGAWRWLQRNGERGPLRWAVAGVHGSAVSQQPDRRALFDLMITPDGYVLDKRGM